MIDLLPRLTLVLGGARSGKSRFAEEFVMKAPAPWTYLATAEAYDEEMGARIGAHKARRGGAWTTVAAPLDIAGALGDRSVAGRPILIDCLTLWLSNVMLAARDVEAEVERLCSALREAHGPLVIVSNEVGLGVVPDNQLARAFREAQGRLNAEVAAIADHVVLIAAGLPLVLK